MRKFHVRPTKMKFETGCKKLTVYGYLEHFYKIFRRNLRLQINDEIDYL